MNASSSFVFKNSTWVYCQHIVFAAIFLLILIIIEEQEAIRSLFRRRNKVKAQNGDGSSNEALVAENLKKTFYSTPCNKLLGCIWCCCPIMILKAFGSVEANKDISLKMGYNDSRALVGLNGAGKTTFFDLITNRTKPTKGTITLNKRPIEE